MDASITELRSVLEAVEALARAANAVQLLIELLAVADRVATALEQGMDPARADLIELRKVVAECRDAGWSG